MNKPKFNNSLIELFACTKYNCKTKYPNIKTIIEGTAIQTVSTNTKIAAKGNGNITLNNILSSGRLKPTMDG